MFFRAEAAEGKPYNSPSSTQSIDKKSTVTSMSSVSVTSKKKHLADIRCFHYLERSGSGGCSFNQSEHFFFNLFLDLPG